MSDTTIKINLGATQAARKVDMFGSFRANLEQLQKTLNEMQKKALNTGGFIIKKGIHDSMVNKWPASGRPFTVKQPKHPLAKQPYITKTDPIAESIRQTSVRGEKVTMYVGQGDSHSAGYLSKMFETDSKKRFQKSRLGKKLSRPKSLGKLTGVHYFEPGFKLHEDEAYDAMERIIFNRIERAIDE